MFSDLLQCNGGDASGLLLSRRGPLQHGQSVTGDVRTARSRFLLCELSVDNAAHRKYPPQPVLRSVGYEARPEAQEAEDTTRVEPNRQAFGRIAVNEASRSWRRLGLNLSAGHPTGRRSTAMEAHLPCLNLADYVGRLTCATSGGGRFHRHTIRPRQNLDSPARVGRCDRRRLGSRVFLRPKRGPRSGESTRGRAGGNGLSPQKPDVAHINGLLEYGLRTKTLGGTGRTSGGLQAIGKKLL